MNNFEPKDVTPEVIKDIEKRADLGLVKYGKPLRTFNQRRALQDLYEELLDAAQYIKQHLMEVEAFRAEVETHGVQKALHAGDEPVNK